ncbi:transcription factor Opi1-domain-containing protein [Amanita rubescens]|nr:transcription factor Opi1-domain-containing protein [Amanita rubescens]
MPVPPDDKKHSSHLATVDENDESVRIAVSALGDMRNATSSRSTSSSPVARRPSSPIVLSPSLVTRVSHLPLVNSVLRTYEQGKASSRVVKYGAEMMESSVRTISRPVIDRLPVNVNQIDEFACRQLDRFDRYRRASSCETSDRPPSTEIADETRRSSEYASPDSPTSTLAQVGEDRADGKAITHQNEPQLENSERQIAQRSRWQAVLLEAGGLSAAFSDENMRRLKYCLHCLQYATAQIDAQILILRDFIAGLQPLPHTASSSRRTDPLFVRCPVSQAHMRTLTDVRRDLVQTIRQVVDVVSKYAGGALPEPARTRVRGFILKLPQRWASKVGVGVPAVTDGSGAGDRERESVTTAASGSGAVRRPNRRAAYRERGTGSDSKVSSRGPSPSSPRLARNSQSSDGSSVEPVVSAGAAVLAAQRILTLATESLDMMRGVTGVMKDSLDRADAWVNRLRTVGIQRNESTEETAPQEVGAEQPHKFRHHRRSSSSFSNGTCVEDEHWGDCSSGLASPALSGTSTAYSSTPGGYMTAGTGGPGTQSPSVQPQILPLGTMNLGEVDEKEDSEEMEVDTDT